MKKDYQRKAAAAVTGNELVVPDAVSVAMAEIGGAVKESLAAIADPGYPAHDSMLE